MDKRKGRFKTRCKNCNKIFRPLGKYQQICDKCLDKINHRKKKDKQKYTSKLFNKRES